MINLRYFLMIGIFLLFGCKKNQLKKPTDVGFKIDINRAASSTGKLIFTDGTINLAEFDIEGERQEGSDISFSKSFSNGLLVNFNPTTSIPEIDFDIPQGIYTELEISFETFDDNSDITIICNGNYTKNNGNVIPVRFEFMSSESFSIVAEDEKGGSSIILDKNTPANAFVKFDPIYWFDIVPSSLLENANLSTINGTQTLLINDSSNDNIYEMIVTRVEKSTEIKIGN